MHSSVRTARSTLSAAVTAAPAAPAARDETAPATVTTPVPPDRPLPAPLGEPSAAREWRTWGLLVGGCFLFFLALLNPYWVPSGDGDLYVAIARSIALGEGYKFNGQQVNICPPGWPVLLAGIMQVSPTFLAFKLVMIVAMTAQLGMWYWLLRRMVAPLVAGAAVAISAALPHVYSLTFWTHTEAVYCALSTGAMLIALQIAERRGGVGWRVPLLLALCAGCVVIRWAGVLQVLTIGACLMHGRAWWRLGDRRVLGRWLVAGGGVAIAASTFFILRSELALTREQAIAAAEAGAVFDETVQVAQATTESQRVDLVNFPLDRKRTAAEEMYRRVAEGGRWFSWFYWQPFRFLSSVSAVAWVDVAVGWIAISVLTVAVVLGCRRREWIWLGAAAYCAALVLNWPNANARYLVPLAPLLVAGIVVGLKASFVRWTRSDSWELFAIGGLLASAIVGLALQQVPSVFPYQFTLIPLWTVAAIWAFRLLAIGRGEVFARRSARAIGWAFVVGVIACSGVLYAIDLAVARSNRFYDRYEAGFHEELIAACYQLNQMNLGDGDVAVSEKYQNLGRTRKSKYAVRAAALLTNRVVLTVPDKLAGEPVRSDLLRWCQRRDVDYYLHQKPNVPWRVWHFVLPRWLNQKLVKDPLPADTGGWTLYALAYQRVPAAPPLFGGPPTMPTIPTPIPATVPLWEYRRSASMIELPKVRGWPTRVPGV